MKNRAKSVSKYGWVTGADSGLLFSDYFNRQMIVIHNDIVPNACAADRNTINLIEIIYIEMISLYVTRIIKFVME